jgi:hypothetical protein
MGEATLYPKCGVGGAGADPLDPFAGTMSFILPLTVVQCWSTNAQGPCRSILHVASSCQRGIRHNASNQAVPFVHAREDRCARE